MYIWMQTAIFWLIMLLFVWLHIIFLLKTNIEHIQQTATE